MLYGVFGIVVGCRLSSVVCNGHIVASR